MTYFRCSLVCVVCRSARHCRLMLLRVIPVFLTRHLDRWMACFLQNAEDTGSFMWDKRLREKRKREREKEGGEERGGGRRKRRRKKVLYLFMLYCFFAAAAWIGRFEVHTTPEKGGAATHFGRSISECSPNKQAESNGRST